jgi:hypothetical protein
LILISIACVYFACWIPTNEAGADAVAESYSMKYNGVASVEADAVLPLVLKVTAYTGRAVEQVYCLWLFGLKIEVPGTSS